MSYTKGQSAALPTYTLHYSSTPMESGKASANTLELPNPSAYLFPKIVPIDNFKLELPRQLDRLEAVFWASVILTEIANNDELMLLAGTSNRPTLEVNQTGSGTEQISFSKDEDPLRRNYFYVQPATESISAELMRLGVMAREIWGEDSSAITWGVRDLEINAQYPGLNRKLPEKAQAFLDRHNGDLAAAIKTSRLIDSSMPLTWYRSTQKAKG
jgi:hypothetical protein